MSAEQDELVGEVVAGIVDGSVATTSPGRVSVTGDEVSR